METHGLKNLSNETTLDIELHLFLLGASSKQVLFPLCRLYFVNDNCCCLLPEIQEGWGASYLLWETDFYTPLMLGGVLPVLAVRLQLCIRFRVLWGVEVWAQECYRVLACYPRFFYHTEPIPSNDISLEVTRLCDAFSIDDVHTHMRSHSHA